MWRIEKKLAAGGMGDVFLARTPEGERVAVKLSSLQQEVRLLVKLRHPSIVAILGYAAHSDEIFGQDRGPCYWMEYVEGEDVLSAAKKATKDQIIVWLAQALEALQYLHGQGILHGDLSPGNVLIDSKGLLKLVDFGVAGFQESDAALLTGAATLPYMAPEKIDGQAAPASDLYSLGTIFYQAMSGVHPRAGCRSLEELMHRQPKPLGDSLAERIIDRMICIETSERFAQASEVLGALRGGRIGPAPTATDYHSAKMYGADEHFARISRILKNLKRTPALVCVHGATGVGKSRFVREISFQCALSGIKIRLMTSLEERLPEELVPLLKLQTLRPGELIVLEWNDDGLKPECERFFQGLLGWAPVQDIHLKNLDLGDTLKFLEGALGSGAAKESVESLYQQTAGNPALLTELTRCLLEKRVETGKSFSKQWLDGLKGLRSIEDVLRFRLSGLDEDENGILRFLAAAHEPVDVRALSSVLSEILSHDALAPKLSRLIGKELVLHESRTGLYRLALPSLEEAVLKSLTSTEVECLHRSWMSVLQEEPDNRLQKLHHAIALKDEDRVQGGACLAVEALSSEGRREEALVLVNKVLAVIRNTDETSRLLRLKINLMNDLGRFEAALEICDEWFELEAHDEPKPLRAVKYWFITGLNHQNLGNPTESEARLKRCLAEGDPANDAHRPLLVRAYSRLGAHEMSQGRIEAAREYFKKGLDLAGPTGRRRAELCRNLAEAVSIGGDWTGARKLFEDAIRHYREDHYDEGEFSVRLQEGNLALVHNDLETAEASYAKAQEVADRRNNDLQGALVESNRGILAQKIGNLAEALKLLERAQEIFQLLGRRGDLSRNLYHLAMTEASLGRFAKASERIEELRKLASGVPESDALVLETEVFLEKVRDGVGEEDNPSKLRDLFAKLPPELQLTFAERQDFKRLVLEKTAGESGGATRKKTEDIVGILDDLTEINRELLEETDMNRLLKRLMDRALELAKAENGFLVLKSDAMVGPLPGFTVAVARNISKKALEKEEFRPSLTAVKRAMQTGLPVVTDNAVEDPLFREAKSVHLQKLKSLLALPVIGTEGVLGIFYLDHRFAKGLFEGETLAALKTFAGIAALALQKGQMIEELKASNRSLSEEVEIKTSEMGLMQRELKKSRMVLKNEYSEIVGRSPKMVSVLALLDRITDAKIAVWIYGESGTGKESIARALHFNSPRVGKPFATENCSALPENLLESELFGHKKGSFTHAVGDKKGILQYADGGTIFLDEIADMSLGLQAKLLRFLQEGEIRPVGSTQMIKVDVRVVSASNRILAELVKRGKFREDLFFRLNGVTVSLPPLRERMEDLPLLADHFLEKLSQREKKPKHRISQDVMRLFMGYDWPGNIRELQNTIETAALFSEKGIIVPESLQFKPGLLGKYTLPKAASPKSAQDKPIPQELEKMLRVIRDEGFHRANAARTLGMSRRNFYTKLEKFGVPRDFKSLKEYVDKYVG